MATAEKTAQQFDIPLAFDDPAAMATHDEVDVVDICVNVFAHHALVPVALDAGKHVFCEWPLGATLEEAEALHEQAVRAGVKHMVGLQARGAPVYQYMKQLIADGYVGEVLSASGRRRVRVRDGRGPRNIKKIGESFI